MTTSTSLIDLILNLLRDPEQRAAFQQNPDGFLAACGGDLSPEDVRDAITLADDATDDDSGSREGHSGGHQQVHVPPPHATHPHPGESDHDAAVRYLQTYVTNNHSTENNTSVDDSLHQHIDTHGGDVDQDIDNHQVIASGEGSVAAGGSITGTTTTGDGNQVGTGNLHGEGNVVGTGNQAVTGADSTTSFGAGAASSDHVGGGVGVGDGASYSGTAAATTDNTDDSVADSLNDSSDHHVSHSFDDSSDHSTHTDDSAHDSLNDRHDGSTHTDDSVDHSYNADLHV